MIQEKDATCIFNNNVLCHESLFAEPHTQCEKCGWNKEVAENRLKIIKEKRRAENGKGI